MWPLYVPIKTYYSDIATEVMQQRILKVVLQNFQGLQIDNTPCRPENSNLLEKIRKCKYLTIATAKWIMRDTTTLIFEPFQLAFNCKRNEVFTYVWIVTWIDSICVRC